MNYKIEKYAEGKFDVTAGDYPQRIGHIVGGRSTWLAERGKTSLGYYKTRKAAATAITKEFQED